MKIRLPKPCFSSRCRNRQIVVSSGVRKNASDIADLRDTLNTTTVTGTDGVLITLRKLLMRRNITIDQITGVYVGGDGQITLFYQ